jgi:CelD/BcsL family acetyltransferase involved in cellulose biosynthesis
MKKNRLPQKRQKLEGLLGEVRFEPHDQQIDEVLDFMQMGMRERFADGGPKIFDTQRRSAFTRQTTLELMADGVARLSTLRSADRLLAVEIVHEIDGVHISDFGTFDGDLRSYSLGYMVLHEVLRQALSEGMQAVDLRGGDFPDKYAWANSGRVSRSFSVVRPGRYGDVQFRARVIANRDRHRELTVIDRTPIGTLG